MKWIFIFLIVPFFLMNEGLAQENKKDYSKLTRDEIVSLSYEELLGIPFEDLMKLAERLGVSVDDLLNMKITVSSKSAMTSRESPGIVSIVTSDEIKNSGARDLIDVLNLIPGFQFGYDVDGAIGLASRGNWGHEGKILILLDGQEMNENFYSTFQFGNHIPVDQIKRIEIIRGPGSCIYGGYAELGVINIISKEAADIKGISVESANGLMAGGIIRNDVSVMAGQKVDNIDYTIGGYISDGHRSNKIYENFDYPQYNLAGNGGEIRSQNINISAGYKTLKTRLIYDNYSTRSFDYDSNPMNNFTSYLGEIKYDFKVNEKLTISPRFNFKSQIPWHMVDTSWSFHRKNNRYNENVTVLYQPVQKLVVTAGAELTSDFARTFSDDLSYNQTFASNGKNNVSYNNFAAFLQGYFQTSFINISLGGRFDRNDYFGNNIAPRVGLTRVIDKFHFKALYSGAFRTPAIENIDLNTGIKAEHTQVAELEAGYQLNKSMFITANIFNIYIKNPIVYQSFPDQNDSESYTNFPSTGTQGYEIEYRLVKQKGYLTVTYSYYMVSNNKATDYDVTENSTYLQGFSKHKFTLNSMFKFSEHINFNPSIIFFGPRYGQFMNASLQPEQKKMDATLTINLFANYNNLFVKNLDLGLGIYDILDKGTVFIQPYGKGFPPLPGYSREFEFRLKYRFEM